MEKAAVQYLTFVVFVTMLCASFIHLTGTFDLLGITGSKDRIGNETRIALEKVNSELKLYIANETKNLEKLRDERIERQFFYQTRIKGESDNEEVKVKAQQTRQPKISTKSQPKVNPDIFGDYLLKRRPVPQRAKRIKLAPSTKPLPTTTTTTTTTTTKSTTTTPRTTDPVAIRNVMERRFNQQDLMLFKRRMSQLHPGSRLAKSQAYMPQTIYKQTVIVPDKNSSRKRKKHE